MNTAIPELRSPPFLILIIPCYNEEQTLPTTFQAIGSLLSKLRENGVISEKSLACYVDDGSTDSTWNLLEGRHASDPHFRAIGFASNAGHQNALWAGLEEARALGADCAISVDADLQDDIGVIPEMISQWTQGYDIVYGVRDNRDTDSAFKRGTARLFYKLMNKLDVGIIPDHPDFRLMGKPAIEALLKFDERNLFLRGLIPRLGFRSAKVFYRRGKRKFGETKYPLRKMLSFAWTGITSASAAPLRLAGVLSFLCMILALFLAVFQIYRWNAGENVPGWTSLFLAVLFLGSIQLFCLAVIGEYIAKIFTEVRRRPRYIIERRL